MPTVKTAISMQKSLFQQVDELARQLDISRSSLFVKAVEDYLQRYENQELLKAINAAYDDLPDQEERTYRKVMRQRHRDIVEGTW